MNAFDCAVRSRMDREEALLVYEAFSIAELKEQISQRGLSSDGCVERSDLIDLLLTDDSRQMQGFGGTSSTAGPGPSSTSGASSGPRIDDQKVTEFCSLTGADPETAVHVLEAMGGNLDQAVNLFFETGGAGFGGRQNSASSAATGATSSGHAASGDEDEVRAPMPTMRDTLIGGPSGLRGPMPMPPVPPGGIRAPQLPSPDSLTWGGAMMAQNLANMLNPSAVASGAASIFGRPVSGPGDDETVEWMFKPPAGLSMPTSFADTRAMCKQSHKWLLVNIQDHDNFKSHSLNRDVWGDETIQCLIQAEFAFWQRNKTAPEGIQFMSRYHIDASHLPIICIIDPRTGLKVRDYDGTTIKADDLATILMDFVGQQSLHSLEPTRVKSHSLGGSGRKDSMGGSASAGATGGAMEQEEDPDLLRALQMSMADAGAAAEQDMPTAASSTAVPSSSPPCRVVQVPPEPPESAPASDITKVSVRLADGRRVQRTFWKADKVEVLYAFVEEQAPDARRMVGPSDATANSVSVHDYELLCGFPHKSLAADMDRTLAEAKLANELITMRFVN